MELVAVHGADHAQGYFFARPAPAAMVDLRIAEAGAVERGPERSTVVGIDTSLRRRTTRP